MSPLQRRQAGLLKNNKADGGFKFLLLPFKYLVGWGEIICLSVSIIERDDSC
jgi:hypothetical protein